MTETGTAIITLIPFVLFAVAFIVITVFILRAIGLSKKNTAFPRIETSAKIIGRRTAIMPSSDMHRNMYFITFEFSTGDRAEYRVTEDTYGYFVEGDEGTLTIRGTEFISFRI